MTEITVSKVARMTGVTVRTLHHYEEIGLLVPRRRSRAGYRLYDEENLLRLQQILVLRELGLSLEVIGEVLDDTERGRIHVLRSHLTLMRSKIEQLERMTTSIEATIQSLERNEELPMDDMFDGFEPERYEEEVRRRWGDTDAYAISAKRTKRYGPDEWRRIKEEADELARASAALLEAGAAPDGVEAMDVAEGHRLHIDRWFYPCPPELHASLADLYTGDPRFAATYEAYREGLAAFFAASVEANAERQQRRAPQAP